MSQYFNQYGGYKQPSPSYGYPQQQPYYGGPGTTPMPQQQPPQQPPAQAGGVPPGGAGVPLGAGAAPTGPQVPGMLPIEQSYIENILRLNKGKLVDVYATFENNTQWNAKVFRGIIEAAGRDHLILSDPQTGARYLIPMVYVDYVTFEEEIEYEYPFSGTPMATFPPR